ncbi:unnamed protein product [Sphagnum jensenii]|uniref:GST C-terminal domain-containing protein n=1 Tax=Sphagnum jensenii TaxID=128206 RepID=A0ABP1BJZ0_9BRYO
MTSGDVFDTLTDREAGGLQYLEEKFPEKGPLLPKDLLQRAHIYQVVFLMSANIQPLQNSRIVLEIENKLGKEEPKKWAHHFIVKGFTALEQILEKTAGKYCFGDNVTLVRSFNFSPFALDQFYSTLAAPPLSVGILHRAPYPTIQRVMKALYELPEVKASLPANQPDAPKS